MDDYGNEIPISIDAAAHGWDFSMSAYGGFAFTIQQMLSRMTLNACTAAQETEI